MRYFIAAMLLCASQAQALEYEIAIGRSEFCCLQEGVWWQYQFGFNGSVHSKSWEVGARQRWGSWSLHGAYVDLGEVRGANVATMRDVDAGKFDTTKPCDPATQNNCLGYFDVTQRVSGVLIGAAYGRSINGVMVDGEVGQYFYQSGMNVSIWCPSCGYGAPGALFSNASTFSYSSNLRRSSYVAIRAEYKKIFITVRRFTNIDGNGTPGGSDETHAQFATGLTIGPVNQILIGMSI